jgi:hypothetical protein
MLPGTFTPPSPPPLLLPLPLPLPLPDPELLLLPPPQGVAHDEFQQLAMLSISVCAVVGALVTQLFWHVVLVPQPFRQLMMPTQAASPAHASETEQQLD